MRPLRVRLLWHPQPQFAGVILAAQLGLDRTRGVAIEMQPIDFAEPHVEAVLNGSAEAAVASPAHVLESRAPNALRLVAVFQQTSALAYPARLGIKGLADLRGRRAAVWPGHEHLELRAMLASADIGDADVTYVETPDTVGALSAGRADLAQATLYHELPHLLAENGAAWRVFHGKEHGIDLIKDGLVVEARLAERAPETVQALVEAVQEGWRIALDDPKRAVAACRRARPDMGEEEQRAQLAAVLGLVRQGASVIHGLGYPDPTHEAAARRALAAVEPHRTLPAAPITDTRFWSAAPEALRPRLNP